MTKAEEGTAYPIEGGMIETVKPYAAARKAYMMQVSGIQNIKRELAGLKAENFDRPVLSNAWPATAAAWPVPA